MDTNTVLYTSLGLWNNGVRYGHATYQLSEQGLSLWHAGEFFPIQTVHSDALREITSCGIGKSVILSPGQESLAKYHLYASVSLCATVPLVPQIGLTPLETEILGWLVGAKIYLGVTQLVRLQQLKLTEDLKAAYKNDPFALFCAIEMPGDERNYENEIYVQSPEICVAVTEALDGLRMKKQVVLF